MLEQTTERRQSGALAGGASQSQGQEPGQVVVALHEREPRNGNFTVTGLLSCWGA